MRHVGLVAFISLGCCLARAQSAGTVDCYGENTSAILAESQITNLELEINRLDSSSRYEIAMPQLTSSDFSGRPYVDFPAPSTLSALASGVIMRSKDGSDSEVSVTLKNGRLFVRGSENLIMICDH